MKGRTDRQPGVNIKPHKGGCICVHCEAAATLTAHVVAINLRLPSATPQSAYCLGLLSGFVLETKRPIPATILDAAMQVQDLRQAIELARSAFELGKRKS